MRPRGGGRGALLTRAIAVAAIACAHASAEPSPAEARRPSRRLGQAQLSARARPAAGSAPGRVLGRPTYCTPPAAPQAPPPPRRAFLLLPYPERSHVAAFVPLAGELASRGHRVTLAVARAYAASARARHPGCRAGGRRAAG
jgi:hypothetical protein